MNAFRQGIARYLSPEELVRVRAVRVGVAGAGGLGSNCAQMLVRSGFEDLVVVDHDTVEHSNLNRQFFFARQVGMPKVQALRANLLDINPDAAVRAVQERITSDNVGELFRDRHVVVEAFDAAQAKKMLVEALLGTGVFLVAASGLAGCGESDRIVTRRVREDFYLVGDFASEATAQCPPLAPRVTLAAAKQADIVLDFALRRPL
ncbi:tRNA threonylcarbamoyladenosine dehydratase [Fundidesulfovibrio magnetotacticus]|uniref:tRNA threonylcarbamoyladenosine dehydratase n=1 Tax=Fundidesulfovibrio magnetotacticus TaxID=2730080 RepID=A0A6V8LLU3_9BACT|nr:sulfur carrier protein ThiS adenylyltransferase ThiF [Fundidesulfovibrio magnetotacticus]GFK92674.1 tRNA threonylcarbamoyladenosine dehydratase [Fundidesulfovibrio magnetotacticus]